MAPISSVNISKGILKITIIIEIKMMGRTFGSIIIKPIFILPIISTINTVIIEKASR